MTGSSGARAAPQTYFWCSPEPSIKSLLAPKDSLLRENNSLFRCAGNLLQAVEFTRRLGVKRQARGQILKNSLLISLLAGNSVVETGSQWTASTATVTFAAKLDSFSARER